jgi:hypothetical protein
MKKILLISLILLSTVLFTSTVLAKDVTVIFDYPGGVDFEQTVSVSEDANAYAAMVFAANNNSVNLDLGYYEGLGNYVNSINDITPGATEYWGFFTNYESAQTGISSYIPTDGGIISFSIIDFSYSAADYNFVTKNNGVDVNAEIYIGNSTEVFGVTGTNGLLQKSSTLMPGTHNIIAKYDSSKLTTSVLVDGSSKEVVFNFSTTNTNSVDDALNWLVINQDENGQIGTSAVWGNTFSLMALSLFDDHNSTKESAINYLLDNQGSDAGFSYPGYSSDALHSSVAIISLLANNYELSDFDINNITSIDFLKTKQENDGGFSGWGTSDNDTSAWSSIAFASSNITLPTKNSLTAIEFMLSTQNADGGFPYSANAVSSVEYTSEVLIALNAQEYSKNSVVNDAITYLENKIDVNGCVDNAYKTSMVSLAFNAYDENVVLLNNCIGQLQFSDGGFSRNATSNSVDTALAILALSEAKFPLVVGEAEDNNGVVRVHSTIEFSLTITNNGKVSAKNVEINMGGIDESWINEELSDLSISEIKAGQSVTALIYVTMKEVGNYNIVANLSGEGISTTQSSNLLPFEIDQASLDLVLTMN